MMFEDPAIQINLDMINSMSQEQRVQLVKDMSDDTALFCETCFPHVMLAEFKDNKGNYFPEVLRAFAEGELVREDYMPQVHMDMYDGHNGLFNNDFDNLAEVCGRGLAKTTVKNLCNIKNICYNFFDIVGFISETKDQAAQDLTTMWDELEHNPIIRRLFGKFTLAKDNQYTKIFIHPIYKTEIVYIATGMNGRIRGMNYKKQRPKLVCIDDFESETNSLTPLGRDKVQRTINSKIINLGGHSLWKMAFYGTIVHHEAFLAQCRNLPLFQSPNGKYIECALSKSPSIVYDQYKERNIVISTKKFQIGIPAWPQRYDDEWIKKKMQHFQTFRGGTEFWQFLQEFYNIPRTDSDPVFDVDQIIPVKGKFIRQEHLAYIELEDIAGDKGQDADNPFKPYKRTKKVPLMVFSGVDPAAGRELQNDRTVIMTIGVTPAGKFIILDINAARLSYEEQRTSLVDTYKKFRPNKIAIESFGYQLSFYDSVQDLFRKQGLYASLKKYNRTNISKSNKFKQYLIPLVNSGQICYLEGCSNIDLLIKELAAYSFETEHDDTIDGLYLCTYAAGTSKPMDVSVDDSVRQLARDKSVFAAMRQPANTGKFATDFMNY